MLQPKINVRDRFSYGISSTSDTNPSNHMNRFTVDKNSSININQDAPASLYFTYTKKEYRIFGHKNDG